MNYVEVIGGPAKEREVVEKVVHWCIKRLLPRVRTLDIEVKLTKCYAQGYALMTDDHKTFELEIRKGMNLYELISTVCHEMVHVKQYYRKQMDDTERGWMGKQISEDVPYEKTPWEVEAFAMEEGLAMECFREINVNFSK